MQIVGTVVFLAYLDENDPHHAKSNEYIFDIGLRKDLFVPSATLLELDLELKSHGANSENRAASYTRLTRLISQDRFLPITTAVLHRGAEASKIADWRGSYLDTLIASTGLEFGADSAVTTDRKFAKLGTRPVF